MNGMKAEGAHAIWLNTTKQQKADLNKSLPLSWQGLTLVGLEYVVVHLNVSLF